MAVSFPHSIIRLEDKNYPDVLRKIHKPPALLYARGNLELLHSTCFAIVGTRDPTDYGRLCAKKFTHGLVGYGFTIVSGLAYGIDAVAHETVLECGGKTIAVLGSGVDNIHPTRHENLAHRIVKSGGLIVSEYGPGTPPLKHHFPARNRIISGLSLGTLIVEAPQKSGALITAKHALDQNREVFALPGTLLSRTHEGNHHLIAREMARLVRTPEDIISRLSHQPEWILEAMIKDSPKTPEPALSTTAQKKVWTALSKESLFIDQMIPKTQLSIEEIQIALSYLELKGYVQEVSGGKFMKT